MREGIGYYESKFEYIFFIVKQLNNSIMTNNIKYG